ncbi:MAG: acetate uptake transporter [Frankiaceae bacterium]
MTTESGVAAEQVPERPGAAAVADPTIADPGPLGLAAFAATTFMLSVFNAKLMKPATLEAVFLPFALFYGGVAQLLAGMWEFKKANTFGALAFTSYGAFWLTFWYLSTSIAPKLPPLDAHRAIGLYLLTWTIFTAYMLIAAFRVNGAMVAVFGALLVTFVCLTIGNWGLHANFVKLGGWFGILTALLGWYASFAGVLSNTWGRVVLPVFPLAPGAKATPRRPIG